jgi:competence protein ComEC
MLALLPAIGSRWGLKAAVLVVAAATLACAGGWRFEGWQERPTPDLAQYVGRTVVLEGRITSEPKPGLTTSSYRITIDRILLHGRWVTTDGSVRATFHQYATFHYGTELRVEGRLRLPPIFEGFDYRAYLARQGIVATMLHPEVEVIREAAAWNVRRQAVDLRLRLEESLQRSLPEPEASLGAGIAFGRDAHLPKSVYDDFRTTGLAHLVAVSGSNVSLVAALAFLTLTPVAGRRWAMVPAAMLIVSYVLVAGVSASVVRAGIMALIFLGGAALGRQQSGLAALGAAAVAMTAFQPGAARDPGFQLSLAATAGLIVFGPWVQHALERGLTVASLMGLVPRIVVQAAALTLSATLATMPIIWVNFGEISLIGPFANMVAGPVFAVTFVLSLVTAIVGLAWVDGGWLLGLAAYYPLAGLIWLSEWAATVPGASVTVPGASGTFALGCYLLLAIAGWPAFRYLAPSGPPRKKTARAASLRRLMAAAGAGATVLAVFPVSLQPIGGPGELRIAVLDVGQGDAVLITSPGGYRVLIDGGPSGIELARELGAVLPHWQRRIDLVILTHPEEDHVAGLPHVLKRYQVGMVADPGVSNVTATYELYDRLAASRRSLQAGDSFVLDGVTFEVLWPPVEYESQKRNNHSLVLRVSYGSTVILLTGDFEAAAQRALMKTTDVEADVLKVPHHGSKTSAVEFLGAVGALTAVISAGESNRYGHPAAVTLDALAGTQTFRTDIDGRVVISTDGSRLRVTTER